MSSIEFGFEGARLEGIEQGKKQGIQQGIRQGIEQGMQQGVKQGIEQVAIRLLESGELSEDGICAVANISKKQLAEIKRKIHVTRGSL